MLWDREGSNPEGEFREDFLMRFYESGFSWVEVGSGKHVQRKQEKVKPHWDHLTQRRDDVGEQQGISLENWVEVHV